MNSCARFPHFLPLSQVYPHLLEWKTETQKGRALTYLFVLGFSTRSGTSISSPCDPLWSVVCRCSMVLTVLSAEAIPLPSSLADLFSPTGKRLLSAVSPSLEKEAGQVCVLQRTLGSLPGRGGPSSEFTHHVPLHWG